MTQLEVHKSDLLDEYAPEKWMLPQEVADTFGVTVRTISKHFHRGTFVVTDGDGSKRDVQTFRTPGNHIRYNAEDIQQFRREHNEISD